MRYQLVIQFKQEFFNDLQVLWKLADLLENSLLDVEVDGHDIGSGELNVFIHTNHPIETLEEIKLVFVNHGIDVNAIKSGYRLFSSNIYTPIWHLCLEKFSII